MTGNRQRMALILVLTGALSAVAFRQDAAVSWPEPGAPGADRLMHIFEQQGMTITLAVSEVVADREGRMFRFVTLSEVGTDSEGQDIRSLNVSNVRIDRADAVGSGSSTWSVHVAPTSGSNWVDVHNPEDVVLTVTATGTSVPNTPLQRLRHSADR